MTCRDGGDQQLAFTVDAVHAFMRKRRDRTLGEVQRCVPPRPLPQQWSPLPLTKPLAAWTCSTTPAHMVINEKFVARGQGGTIVGTADTAFPVAR